MAQRVRLTDKVSHMNEEDELRKRGYILGITLGEGSYAKVRAAHSETHQIKVALKIINRAKAPKDFQQRFLPRELDILKRLDHPNVIKLIDIMHFNHKVYIAMEMAGHGDLLEYIKLRGAIPEDKSKMMFQQIVNAIEYLQSIHIIHRDLKCENILLDTNNKIKISDFGFARLMYKDDVSKTFCGSAAYAAPEILQGIPYTGHAYDIWSIGVILYIMVCGSMPYDDSNVRKMIKYQTEIKVKFTQSRQISDFCKHLIHRMLEADIPTRATIAHIQTHPWLAEVKAWVTTPKTPVPNDPNNNAAPRLNPLGAYRNTTTENRPTVDPDRLLGTANFAGNGHHTGHETPPASAIVKEGTMPRHGGNGPAHTARHPATAHDRTTPIAIPGAVDDCAELMDTSCD